MKMVVSKQNEWSMLPIGIGDFDEYHFEHGKIMLKLFEAEDEENYDFDLEKYQEESAANL